MKTDTVIATVSSKGQVTIPAHIRKILHITRAGELIGFVPLKEGVLMKHLEIRDEDFSEEEWDKLERLAGKKGMSYKNAKDFLKAIKKI